MNKRRLFLLISLVAFSIVPAASLESEMTGVVRQNYDEGLQLQARGDHVHATWRFGMAIQQSPYPSADLFFSRGVSYMALGNYAQAKADFEQALRVRPNFAAAQTKLADCRRALGIGSAPPPGQSLYDNFKAVLDRSHLSLAEHRSYTEQYVTARARLFCGLMSNGDMTKLTQEISFPPVFFFDSAKDRPRLEAAILMTGTPAMCPANQPAADQWLHTYMRQ